MSKMVKATTRGRTGGGIPILFVFLFTASFVLHSLPSAAYDVEYPVDLRTDNNQFVLLGDYRKVFSPYDEVVILSIDRPMGVGIVEAIAGSYMVVRAMRIDPGFFHSDATRIRKLVLEKPATIKKTIDPYTIIDYDPEIVTLDVWHGPDMNQKKVKKQPHAYVETYGTEPVKSEGAAGAVKISRRREKAETTVEPADQVKTATKATPKAAEPLPELKENGQKDSSQKSSRRRRSAETKQEDNGGAPAPKSK